MNKKKFFLEKNFFLEENFLKLQKIFKKVLEKIWEDFKKLFFISGA